MVGAFSIGLVEEVAERVFQTVLPSCLLMSQERLKLPHMRDLESCLNRLRIHPDPVAGLLISGCSEHSSPSKYRWGCGREVVIPLETCLFAPWLAHRRSSIY